MTTLEVHRQATLPWAYGPFYPDAMAELAAVIAAAHPRDKIDLSPAKWCLRSGFLYREVWDIEELDDGYRPQWAIRMVWRGTIELWLVLPQLVVSEDGLGWEFERMPAFYTTGNQLSTRDLERATKRMTTAFRELSE